MLKKDPKPVDLTKRGKFPIPRKRPDGTIELIDPITGARLLRVAPKVQK